MHGVETHREKKRTYRKAVKKKILYIRVFLESQNDLSDICDRTASVCSQKNYYHFKERYIAHRFLTVAFVPWNVSWVHLQKPGPGRKSGYGISLATFLQVPFVALCCPTNAPSSNAPMFHNKSEFSSPERREA